MAWLCSHLRKDLVDLGKEAYDEDEEYMAPSVIRDLLDQLSELSKRYLGIRTMMDEDPKIDPISLREFDPITRSHKTSSYSVPKYLHKFSKKLLINQKCFSRKLMNIDQTKSSSIYLFQWTIMFTTIFRL